MGLDLMTLGFFPALHFVDLEGCTNSDEIQSYHGRIQNHLQVCVECGRPKNVGILINVTCE